MKIGKGYLCNHHVAIKCSLSVPLGGLCDMASDFRNDWCTKGDVGYEMAVHDINCHAVSNYV